MITLSPREAVVLMYESVAAGDYDKARSLLHPDYHSHTQPHETSVDAFFAEIDAIKRTMTATTRETILTMEEGEMAVILQRVAGIHKDTGDKIAYRSADFFRIAEDGRIREHWDAVTFDGSDLFDTIEPHLDRLPA
jgi:predicted SnoaL-like aldol condensation-catalyzing enzyme